MASGGDGDGRGERDAPETDRAEVEVRAGGGALWRHGVDRTIEVLVVHRPRYDDWSLPKGKCDPGETYRDAAVREVREETGHDVEVGASLGEVRYVDHKGRSKAVRYWAMTVTDGRFAANDEVDRVRWLPIAEAEALLTYDHDAPVLAALAERC